MNAFSNFAQNQGYQQGPFPNPATYNQPYQAANPTHHMTDPLTDEQRSILKSQYEDAFDLKVSQQEIAYAICAHKRDDKFDLVADDQGNAICRTCGAKFRPDEVTEEYVQNATEQILNVLQTIKMLGVDLNVDVFRQYFAMIPYIQRIPKLYKVVLGSFEKYNNNFNPAQQYYAGPNVNTMFNYMMNPAMPMGGGYPPYPQQYPNYGQPATPFMNQQAQMVYPGQTPFYAQPNPQYGQQMPPQGAPMNNPQQPVANQPQVGSAENSDASVKQKVQL